ncbi:MAG: Dabb family protein [Gorillibacterium sp.]|nr:Dabb family protein [Gorillibacterium sp.]
MSKEWIQHSVIFCLKHESGSEKAEQFLEDGRTALSAIPVVQNFRVYRQVSPKNDYSYGFSMEFASHDDYESYNTHPNHVDFVESRWINEVTRFLEIDYKL